VLGRLGNIGETGLSAFVDAGKLWAGDAPYGVTSPVRAAAGSGRSAPFRAGRAGVAGGRGQAAHAGARRPAVQIVFENRDLTRLFWREPRDLQLGRERALSESLFNWP
jgi:hypothetical protein